MYRNFLKRVFDLISSTLLLIVISPIFLLLILMIKIDSKGPVFFKQMRVGKNKKLFKIYKFRTMKIDTPKDMPTHMLKDPDKYITRVGRFLRKTSLDELPQLLNIIAGQMAVVGPRPALWNQEDLIKERDKYHANDIRPGLTGWAQVCGYRGDTSIEGRIEHDIFYIENWTLTFDIKILILTVFKGFINKNAY